jgi:hypothetical protein
MKMDKLTSFSIKLKQIISRLLNNNTAQINSIACLSHHYFSDGRNHLCKIIEPAPQETGTMDVLAFTHVHIWIRNQSQ